jgi:NADH-quinone oxidoreductase subunit I
MYCGICVEVCPFDALHWSPFFEYTSYTYEGMVHERDVLSEWQHHVLPPPELVPDADEKARELTHTAREKREQGIAGVIREADKKAAFLAKEAAAHGFVATAPAAPVRESSDTPPEQQPAMAAEQAPAAPVPPSAPEAAAPQAPERATAQAPEAAVPSGATADTGDLPRIDPNNLPDGIGPVERGRLKKLGVLQERGQAPPADLVDNLRPILDQMKNG